MVSPDEVALAQIGKVVRVLSLEGEVVVADPIALARKIITGLSRHKCKKVQDRLETLSYTVFQAIHQNQAENQNNCAVGNGSTLLF